MVEGTGGSEASSAFTSAGHSASSFPSSAALTTSHQRPWPEEWRASTAASANGSPRSNEPAYVSARVAKRERAASALRNLLGGMVTMILGHYRPPGSPVRDHQGRAT